MKKFDNIGTDKNGEKYSQWIEVEDDKALSWNCTCKFSSFYGWSRKNQERKTICRHLLKMMAKHNLYLPEEYQTERNMNLIEKFINDKEVINK